VGAGTTELDYVYHKMDEGKWLLCDIFKRYTETRYKKPRIPEKKNFFPEQYKYKSTKQKCLSSEYRIFNLERREFFFRNIMNRQDRKVRVPDIGLLIIYPESNVPVNEWSMIGFLIKLHRLRIPDRILIFPDLFRNFVSKPDSEFWIRQTFFSVLDILMPTYIRSNL
jgi:hypothetical protein